MTPISLAIASIKSRPLHAALCIVSVATGIALLCAVFLLSQAVEDGLSRNAQSVDVVVGAKGSPLQLVLSTVYHADVPTGNIDAGQIRKLERHPQVRQAIPLALGDNYRGWRITGTTPAYIDLFGADFAEGRIWQKPFDAVAGALTGISIDAEFAGAHGLSADSEDIHASHTYKITGVLKPTGTVLDRLILTSLGSVQELHHHDHHGHHDAETTGEVTALLLQVKSPVAVMNLPREINRTSDLMAASPSYEMARLAKNIGVGRSVLLAFSLGFIALSVLMLLSALMAGMTARRYDLGVLRVLGASPLTLAATVMAEGALIGLSSAVLGIIAGHALAFAAATCITGLQGIILPADFLAPITIDAELLLAGLGIGLMAGALPAFLAGRTDIADILARGRA